MPLAAADRSFVTSDFPTSKYTRSTGRPSSMSLGTPAPVGIAGVGRGATAPVGSATVAGGGLALGLPFAFDNGAGVATAATAKAAVPEVNAWVVVMPDERCVIRIARSEMGQGTITGLAQLVAEELECDWKKVTVEQITPGRNLASKRACRCRQANRAASGAEPLAGVRTGKMSAGGRQADGGC